MVQIARPVDEDNRELRQEHILETARQVFCQKGFINVTMTDLIEAAGMSRGGFYFYYQSVGEVFRLVLERRKSSKFEAVLRSIEQNPPFEELLDSYLAKQKERLLHLETSLIRALYEYLFTNREPRDVAFRKAQKTNIMETVRRIFDLGVQQKVLHPARVHLLAEHFMYTIEGLNVMALFQGLDEATIDRQFHLLKQMVTSEGDIA